MPITDLPIESIRSELKQVLRNENKLVLEAPTGSGKSTQIPQMLLDEKLVSSGEIWVLQPRRIAARMLAKRIAWERGTKVGEEIGYQIRFNRVCSNQTRILLVTEGILLRKMLNDPDLKGIGAIVFDEFHERNLYSDLSLAKAVEIQKLTRPDLMLTVMSATLDGDKLEQFLNPCARLNCEGRTYPVEISYQANPAGQNHRIHNSQKQPIWELAAAAFRNSIRAGNQGSHLIFMPGASEIHRTIRSIENLPESKSFDIHALHGELSSEAQDLAVERSGKSKVIVSTNVAETSLTIPGVEVVIDSGLARIPKYDPNRGVNSILVQGISQASASQRAGRAGREKPGKCIRLWSEGSHPQRPQFETPEIARVDLSETLLMLAVANNGIELDSFQWFEAPNPQQISHAVTVLQDLGAIQSNSHFIEVTELGKKLTAFPLHPRYSRLFLEASKRECLQLAVIVAALSQDRSILLPIQNKRESDSRLELLVDEESEHSDVLIELKAFLMAAQKRFSIDYCRQLGIHASGAKTVARTAEQFLKISENQGLSIEPIHRSDWFALKKCLLVAFSDFLSKRLDKGTLRCAMAHGRKATRRKESEVDSKWFVSTEIEERNVKGAVQVLLSRNSAIDESWIEELFPQQLTTTNEIEWDPYQKRVCKTYATRFRDIPIEEKQTLEVTADEAAPVIAKMVLGGEFKIKAWNYKAENLIERINFVSQHFPEYEIPPITEEDRSLLLEQICYGAMTEKDLNSVEVLPAIMDWLTAEQAPMLDTCAPEVLPNEAKGKLKIRYENGRAILSAKIQQLYDRDPILIAERVPVIYELLAPNQRPVQITNDLEAFWTTSYPQIKKDLKGRYPKHEWR